MSSNQELAVFLRHQEAQDQAPPAMQQAKEIWLETSLQIQRNIGFATRSCCSHLTSWRLLLLYVLQARQDRPHIVNAHLQMMPAPPAYYYCTTAVVPGDHRVFCVLPRV
jgi:hypothetical protein